MREEGLSVAEEIEWFVGIDWASQSHQVCLVDARGECLGERAVAHGGPGIEELCDWLIARTGATPEVIGVAIEMTHGAWPRMISISSSAARVFLANFLAFVLIAALRLNRRQMRFG